MQALAAYLTQRVPAGMVYRDAAHLCIRLFITVVGVPEPLLPLTKEKIADAFAELSASGWVREEGASLRPKIGDRGHWVEVATSILKQGAAVFHQERAEELA